MNFRYILFSIFSLLIFNACGNLEREIEVELPEYDSQIVVECYLEPGAPFRMLLTRSAGYFDPVNVDEPLSYLNSILEQEATVRIKHNSKVYELANENILTPNFFNSETNKISNYYLEELVPVNYDQPFELEIITKDGEEIRATTRLFKPIPIDSIVYEFGTNDSARVLTYFNDDPDELNFYRRMLHRNSLDSFPEQDFITDDQFIDNSQVVFGTGYEYAVGDTIINTLFTIEEAYYDFLVSVSNSIDANGNPFAQPGMIVSNIEGNGNAIGIFTGLSFYQEKTIIE